MFYYLKLQLPSIGDGDLNDVVERLANITGDQVSNPTPELLDSISDILDEIVDQIDASDGTPASDDVLIDVCVFFSKVCHCR